MLLLTLLCEAECPWECGPVRLCVGGRLEHTAFIFLLQPQFSWVKQHSANIFLWHRPSDIDEEKWKLLCPRALVLSPRQHFHPCP